jgi:hypothetical protein
LSVGGDTDQQHGRQQNRRQRSDSYEISHRRFLSWDRCDDSGDEVELRNTLNSKQAFRGRLCALGDVVVSLSFACTCRRKTAESCAGLRVFASVGYNLMLVCAEKANRWPFTNCNCTTH